MRVETWNENNPPWSNPSSLNPPPMSLHRADSHIRNHPLDTKHCAPIMMMMRRTMIHSTIARFWGTESFHQKPTGNEYQNKKKKKTPARLAHFGSSSKQPQRQWSSADQSLFASSSIHSALLYPVYSVDCQCQSLMHCRFAQSEGLAWRSIGP